MLSRHTRTPKVHIVPIAPAEPNQPARAITGVADLRLLRVDEFLNAKSLSPNSRKAYRQDLQRFLDWCDTPWAEVTVRQMTQFKQALLSPELQRGKPSLSPATVARVLGTLNNLYEWLLHSGYVTRNPLLTIDKPKLPEPEAQNLSAEQIEQIWQAALDTNLPERNIALVAVLLHGLRVSEVCGLEVDDYNQGDLHIRQAKSDSKGYVPLDQVGQGMLDTYLEWRQDQGEILEPGSPLFVNYSNRSRGSRITYDTIARLIKTIAQKTGLEFHAHQLRHTFATELLLGGMDPYHAMTLTRHKSQQSFRRYTKAADQRAAKEAFYRMRGMRT